MSTITVKDLKKILENVSDSTLLVFEGFERLIGVQYIGPMAASFSGEKIIAFNEGDRIGKNDTISNVLFVR